MIAGVAIDKLCRNSNVIITGPPDATFQNRRDSEFASNIPCVDTLVSVGKGRSTGRNIKVRNPCQEIEQLFGDAVAEIVLAGVAA